jgi:hypothetical protein
MFNSLRRIAAALERLVQLAEYQALTAGQKLPPSPNTAAKASRPARVWDHDDERTYERERQQAKAAASKITGGFGTPPMPPKG